MQITQSIQGAVARVLADLGVDIEPSEVPLEFPAELSHGDYATGIALAKAKALKMKPHALAEKIVAGLGAIKGVEKIEIAGPGFINITLSRDALMDMAAHARGKEWGRGDQLVNQKILLEYTDPNPFKAFHIGHLMSNAIGESLARVASFAGADVIRANYQGDIGVHVACAIWGMQKLDVHPESADEFGKAYAYGATAYKQDEVSKKEIDAINRKLYDRSDPELNELYDTGRKESLYAFERIYLMLGTKFDRYYFESEVGPIGKEIVLAHPKIFPLSDGARIFAGEAYGLHTRVFVNKQGLPTYEAKELGLEKKKDEESPDATQLVVVTANEITDYFKVLKKAMELVYPDIAAKLEHVPHGMMKLPDGKMSSRTGNVITGESLLMDLIEAAKTRAAESRAEDVDKLAQDVAVAAIKFQILKQAIHKDIIFDRERALSLEGDSGPYLQYAHARTVAILEKARAQGVVPQFSDTVAPNQVMRLLLRFPTAVARAAQLREPHLVTNFLIEFAGAFNSWYAREQVLDGTDQAPHKVALVDAVRQTLRNGLWLLGIPAPEKM